MTQSLGWGSEYSSEGIRQVQVGTWLQLIVASPQLYISDCPSISEGKVGWSEVRSQVQGFRRKLGEVREAYQRCLSKAIFRLEKEDYVTGLLYYEVRSRYRSGSV